MKQAKSKFKLISIKRYSRYPKLILNNKTAILIIIFSIVSNLQVNYLNEKYDNLYKNYTEDIKVVATVVSRKSEKSYKYIYKIKVESVNGNNELKNTYLNLNVNKKLKHPLEYGDKVQIIGDFKEPTTQRNYKGFNYKEYLKTEKIYGSLNASNIEIIKKDNINKISLISNKIFLISKEKIDSTFSSDIANTLTGIIFGDTTGVSENIKESFKISNISHILAVSGMHISYIIIGLTYLLIFIGKRKCKICISIFLILYMFITNFSPSVVRATVMAILMLYSAIFYRKNDIWNSMCISLLILLIYNPFLIKNISVQFSYGGTIGIILFQKNVLFLLDKISFINFCDNYTKWRKSLERKTKNEWLKIIIQKVKEILSVTISAQLIILPIMILNFNTLGIYFLISNLIVSFIIGPIVIFGFCFIISSFISLKISKVIKYILQPLLQILISSSNIISNLEYSTIYLKTPDIWQVILYYCFIIIFNFVIKLYITKSGNLSNTQMRVKNLISLAKYKIKQNRKRVILIILVICVSISVIKIYPRNLKIYFIDVGQGDSTLIVTPRQKTILIDGGGSINSDFDVGESTLLPYLLDRKITKLDYIFISHFDQDHVRSGY